MKYSCWVLGLRNLALFLDLLDDSYANCGSHVTNGESSKLRNVLEVFKHHWSKWSHFDESAVAYFEERGLLLNYLAGSRVQLAYQFLEGYPYRSGVSVQYRSVSGGDRGGMVVYDDLAAAWICDRGWVVRMAHVLASPNSIVCSCTFVQAN